MTAIRTVRFSGKASATAVRAARAAMEKDGAVAFRGLLPKKVLEKIRREVVRRHESGELRERGLVRDIGGRYAAVLPFEGPFLDPRFYADPSLHAVLGSLLGNDYRIGSLETVIALPGSSRQHQHIDGPIRFDRTVGGRKKPYGRDLSDLPPYAVTLCVPLCDVDEDNGPTAIWPGSHRGSLRAKPAGAREVARKYPEVHMTGKFGDSFLFDYRVFHGGTPNMTPEARPILMFVFTRSWFRDPNLAEVDQSVVITPRNLARVPERHKHLFGLARASRRALWSVKRS